MSPESISPMPQHRRHGSNSGQPLTRRDGVLKVTGRATYAADNHPADMLYAVTAVSRIARGRVTSLDVEAAKAHPGVVEVLTPANRPPLAHDPDEKMPPFGFRVELLRDGESGSVTVGPEEATQAVPEGPGHFGQSLCVLRKPLPDEETKPDKDADRAERRARRRASEGEPRRERKDEKPRRREK